MLSYQHEYHCGNHADVLKHAVLAYLIESLKRKSKPFRYIDTHAGAGLYDLQSFLARRSSEHRQGITTVMAAAHKPAALTAYLDAVRAVNEPGQLRYYPGSPAIGAILMRDVDELDLIERHPRALRALRKFLRADSRAHIHERDGFAAVPALLPPVQRRGLVLMDPAYERKDEFALTLDALLQGYRRWAGGVYMIWYPLIAHSAARGFAQLVARSGVKRLFGIELEIRGPTPEGLWGSGVLVVNLPYGCEGPTTQMATWLQAALAQDDRCGLRIGWLVGEKGTGGPG